MMERKKILLLILIVVTKLSTAQSIEISSVMDSVFCKQKFKYDFTEIYTLEKMFDNGETELFINKNKKICFEIVTYKSVKNLRAIIKAKKRISVVSFSTEKTTTGVDLTISINDLTWKMYKRDKGKSFIYQAEYKVSFDKEMKIENIILPARQNGIK